MSRRDHHTNCICNLSRAWPPVFRVPTCIPLPTNLYFCFVHICSPEDPDTIFLLKTKTTQKLAMPLFYLQVSPTPFSPSINYQIYLHIHSSNSDILFLAWHILVRGLVLSELPHQSEIPFLLYFLQDASFPHFTFDGYWICLPEALAGLSEYCL